MVHLSNRYLLLNIKSEYDFNRQFKWYSDLFRLTTSEYLHLKSHVVIQRKSSRFIRRKSIISLLQLFEVINANQDIFFF